MQTRAAAPMSSSLLRGPFSQAKEVRMTRVNFDISMSLEGLVAAMSDRRRGELRPSDDIDAERIGIEASRVIQTPLVTHLRVAVRQRAS
jgi:hypothetical protein